MGKTLRSKMLLLYLITVIVPLVIILILLPYYYNGIFVRQTIQLSEGTLVSLTTNIEMYLDDLDRLTLTPYLNDDVMVALKQKASNEFDRSSEYSRYMAERAIRFNLSKQMRNTRKDILGTILLPVDGSVYQINAVDRSGPVPDFPYVDQAWYRKAVDRDGKVAFISSHPQNYIQLDSYKQVFSVARLLKDPDSGKPLAVIMTDAANVVLENIIHEAKFNVSTIVAIVDENNRPLYSSRPLEDSLLGQLSANPSVVKGNHDSYRMISRTMQSSGWRIVVLFSNREFQSRTNWIYLIGAIFAAVGLGLTLLLNLSMTQWIVKPFKQMVQVMKKVQRGDIQTRLPVKGNDEISQVGAALNSMLEQLNQMIDREYKAVLGKRDAEYRALQSQIRPHFLYNTLNGFVGLNRTGQHRLLEKAIMSLSGMMRYTLEHQEMSTLQEEMKFLNQYCELQQLRFQDRLTSAIRYDPALADIRLPKLLLQPLVENAIVHGIEPVARPCEIEIESDFVESSEPRPARLLRIRVKDNGKGFDPALTEEGVGTRNVRERLQLYSKDAGLYIDSRPGEGTTAEFRIPLMEVEVR